MDFNTFLMAIETIVFWSLVVLIAWMGSSAPKWAFGFLFYYIIYLVLRFVFARQGIDRMIYLNVVNIVVLLGLFVYFKNNP